MESGRKARLGMTTFVVVIAVLAAVIAGAYVLVLMPGDVPA